MSQETLTVTKVLNSRRAVRLEAFGYPAEGLEETGWWIVQSATRVRGFKLTVNAWDTECDDVAEMCDRLGRARAIELFNSTGGSSCEISRSERALKW